jgi:hypothetical protein
MPVAVVARQARGIQTQDQWHALRSRTSYLELLPEAAGAAADFFSRQLNRNMGDNARNRALGLM